MTPPMIAPFGLAAGLAAGTAAEGVATGATGLRAAWKIPTSLSSTKPPLGLVIVAFPVALGLGISMITLLGAGVSYLPPMML